MKEDNSFLYSQLVKLGDMMGDGLHHEPNGKWIAREYRKISMILFPDMYKKKRKSSSSDIDSQMKELMSKRNCECGGKLEQRRKGTKVCYCTVCNKRYVAKSTPKTTEK